MPFTHAALKKAERDRAKPRVPPLATIHVVPVERRRAIWPWLIAGVLCVNAALLVLVLRGGLFGQSSSATASGSGAATVASPTRTAAAKPRVAESRPTGAPATAPR